MPNLIATGFGRSLGGILRQKRVELGMTQRELAAAARVDSSYISQLEHGLKSPSSKTLENLAAALGIEVSTLLTTYFTPGASRRPRVYVGREAALERFAEVYRRGGVFVVAGKRGTGKTTFVQEKVVAFCRERRSPLAFFEGPRLSSYREFIRGVRGVYGSVRQGFSGFDAVYEQCGDIEKRLRSRLKDPFSLEVTVGGYGIGPSTVELSYSEKYIYRDAERLLTDEFLAGFASLDVAAPTVCIVDDADLVNPTVGYWIKRFLDRLNESGFMTRRFVAVLTGATAERVGLAGAIAARVTALTLEALSTREVDAYISERGLKLDGEARERIRSLKGDVTSLVAWCDYYDAVQDYNARRLALAADKLRYLEEELREKTKEGMVLGGRELLTSTLRILGHLGRLQGRLEEAASYYSDAVTLAEKDGGPSSQIGYLYLDLGHVARHQGRWEDAIYYYTRADERFLAAKDYLGAGMAHSSLGTTYRLKGKLTRAKVEYKRATVWLGGLIGSAHDAEARRWLASTLSNDAIDARLEAEQHLAKGDGAAARRALDRAKALCREAMAVAHDVAEEAVAESRYGLALAAEARLEEMGGGDSKGLWAEATACYRRALAAFEDLGDRYRVAQVLFDLGVAAAAQGLAHDAIIDFKNSLTLFQQMGSRYHIAKGLVALGMLSEDEEQLSYFAEALAYAREHNEDSLREIVKSVRSGLGKGDRRRARRFLEEQTARDARLKALFGSS